MSIQNENHTGSLFGAILLIAGCCIGAGMLGLPVLSAIAGFKPSLAMFVLCWLFMVATGFLLLEVNLWFSKEVSLISMAGKTLGRFGQGLTWVGFGFLFYTIMVAYISGSGQLFSDFIAALTGYKVQSWASSLVLTALMALFLYLGTKAVDYFNRAMMVGLVLSYIAMVTIGLPHVDLNLLKHEEWNASFLVVPAMIISFGYHNLIPSLTTYLGGNVSDLRRAILLGTFIPLVAYLVWEFLLLGLIPLDGSDGFRRALCEGTLATQLLRGSEEVKGISPIANFFAFFAIVTSFLGVGLSFIDFLADGLNVKKTMQGKLFLCLCVVVPPFVFSVIYPNVFLVALNYAGAFGTVGLFCLLPVAMVWSGRYVLKFKAERVLPGGKFSLIFLLAVAALIIYLQLTLDFSCYLKES